MITEKFCADRTVIGTVPDISQIGVDLNDIGHRATAGLDLGLQALQRGASLRLEVTGMRNAALGCIGNLPGDIKDCPRFADLDRLRVGGRLVYVFGRVRLELGHISLPNIVGSIAGKARASTGTGQAVQQLSTRDPSEIEI